MAKTRAIISFFMSLVDFDDDSASKSCDLHAELNSSKKVYNPTVLPRRPARCMKVGPRQPGKVVHHARQKGWVLLGCTWLYVLLAIWAAWPDWSRESSSSMPFKGYYALLFLLLPVIIWLWAFLAWMGMKFFRHART